MLRTPRAGGSQPCIWMAAGLVRYKLCDRDFGCETCPLDAALRGGSHPSAPPGLGAGGAGLRPGAPLTFPPDRSYSTGHLWLRRDGGEESSPAPSGRLDLGGAAGRWRLGLDAFAAGLLRSCGVLGLRPVAPGTRLGPGESCCELEVEGGTLPLAAPFPVWLEGPNQTLAEMDREAGQGLLEDPYGEGWLARLRREGTDRGGLLGASEAEHQADLDLRRFRRLAGLQLLSEAAALGPCLQDGGAPVSDLRQMLGPRRWLELLRQLVH